MKLIQLLRKMWPFKREVLKIKPDTYQLTSFFKDILSGPGRWEARTMFWRVEANFKNVDFDIVKVEVYEWLRRRIEDV